MTKILIILLTILTTSSMAFAELFTAKYFGKTAVQTGCYADLLVSPGKDLQALKFYYGGKTLGVFNRFSKQVDSQGTQIYRAVTQNSTSSKMVTVINRKDSRLMDLHFKDSQLGSLVCYQMAAIPSPSGTF